MRRKVLNPLILLIAVSLSGMTVASQNSSGVKTRGMFTTKKADGLEIKVLKNVNGAFTLVDPAQEFKAGDEIRLQFRSNFPGQVYFINVSPSGVSKVIYSRQVSAEQMNELPASPEVVTFDKETGVEVLKIVISRQPIEVFDNAIKKSDGVLGQSAASVAKELATTSTKPAMQKQAENVGFVQPDNKPEVRCRGLELALGKEVRCRGLELASGNQKKGEGTVLVARPDGKKSDDGQLKPGEVAVIELRFKHVAS